MNKPSLFTTIYFLIVGAALITFIGTLIGLIVCYSLFQGSSPQNWTLERDANAQVFAHVGCCQVLNVYCGGKCRVVELTIKYPLIRKQVFGNYSLDVLKTIQPVEILDISTQYNCSVNYLNSTSQ